MDKRGVIRFLHRKFLSHNAINLRYGILLCFRNLCYQKNINEKKEGISRFSVELFLSNSAEKLSEGNLLCSENFWFRITLWTKGGYSVFPPRIFFSQCQKSSEGNSCVHQKYFGIERSLWIRRGDITFLRRKLLIPSCRKTS